MTTEDYYIKKQRILDLTEITQEEKDLLIMNLRTDYYAMDKSGYNRLDTSKLKSSMIMIIDKN